jgi:hypothetical protein
MTLSTTSTSDVLETLNAMAKYWLEKDSDRRFGFAVASRMQNVAATVGPLAEVPTKLQARIVSEVIVTEGAHPWSSPIALLTVFTVCLDMCQGSGTLHEACVAYLIDTCGRTPFTRTRIKLSQGLGTRVSPS